MEFKFHVFFASYIRAKVGGQDLFRNKNIEEANSKS